MLVLYDGVGSRQIDIRRCETGDPDPGDASWRRWGVVASQGPKGKPVSSSALSEGGSVHAGETIGR